MGEEIKETVDRTELGNFAHEVLLVERRFGIAGDGVRLSACAPWAVLRERNI